jgi:diguanylate cyclase (GGDEF)-like protein
MVIEPGSRAAPHAERLARIGARLLGAPLAAVTTAKGELAAAIGLDVAPELSHEVGPRPVLVSGGGPAFCGVPLAGGGALCVLDHRPRDWRADDVEALQDLAATYRPFDALTGVPDRGELWRRLESALADARPTRGRVSLLYLDLDNFKLVNDVLGHAAGDDLLRQAVARVGDALGDAGILARYGSDEFAIVLEGAEAAKPGVANAVANRVIAVFGEPFEVDGTAFEIGAFIGIAHHPWHGDTPDSLLEHANAAVGQAKRGGQRRVQAYQAQEEDTSRREQLTLSARLRRAITEDELVLHYQPIVDLSSGLTTRFEALVRWQHPERGLLAPGLFIPQIEGTRLIEELGAWVIEEVCDRSAAWSALRLDPVISFNVAPRQLRQPGFADIVSHAIERRGLDPARFLAEVTESAALDDEVLAGGAMRRLRELGLRTAIDDFGADHSSLGRLRGLAFDILKIDRSFLAEVPMDPKASAVVSAILALTSGIGMTAVAEGVETEPQHRFLVDEGCAYAQGFYLARPMPATDATDLLLAQASAARTARTKVA